MNPIFQVLGRYFFLLVILIAAGSQFYPQSGTAISLLEVSTGLDYSGITNDNVSLEEDQIDNSYRSSLKVEFTRFTFHMPGKFFFTNLAYPFWQPPKIS